jgi:hypothetical protein
VVPKKGSRNAASARQALLLSVIPEYLLACSEATRWW